MDDGYTLLHLHILSIAIPNPDGTFVFRMNLMVGIQAAAIRLLKCLISFFCRQTVESKLNISQATTIGTIDALDGRISRVSITTAIARILVDTNHLKRYVTHIHVLA